MSDYKHTQGICRVCNSAFVYCACGSLHTLPRPDESSYFEDWYSSQRPNGDCAQVQSAWLISLDKASFDEDLAAWEYVNESVREPDHHDEAPPKSGDCLGSGKAPEGSGDWHGPFTIPVSTLEEEWSRIEEGRREMSSGQKDWAEREEAQYHSEHMKRLEALGYSKIASLVEELSQDFRNFEERLPALPRSGWSRLDGINSKIKQLS